MSKSNSRKKYFTSLNDLTEYRAQLKTKQNALKSEIMGGLFNPLNIGTTMTKGVLNLFNRRNRQKSHRMLTKKNKWGWILSLGQLNSLSVLGLLKFFFRTVKKTNWFKWQFIFLTYSLIRFFIKRKKKTAK